MIYKILLSFIIFITVPAYSAGLGNIFGGVVKPTTPPPPPPTPQPPKK
jgi:hypothetical protein